MLYISFIIGAFLADTLFNATIQLMVFISFISYFKDLMLYFNINY